VLGHINWPAVAVAFIILGGRVIWSRAAWWRLIAGIVVLVIVAVGALWVLGLRVPGVPRTPIPATPSPRSFVAQPAIPIQTGASPGRAGGRRREMQQSARAAAPRAIAHVRVRPEPPPARVPAGRHLYRQTRSPWRYRFVHPRGGQIRSPCSRRPDRLGGCQHRWPAATRWPAPSSGV
jgi:hypothetical protein